MSKEELNIKLLALAKLLDEVSVSGYSNLAKIATAINELRILANAVIDKPAE